MSEEAYACVRCGAVFEGDQIDLVEESCLKCGGRLELIEDDDE